MSLIGGSLRVSKRNIYVPVAGGQAILTLTNEMAGRIVFKVLYSILQPYPSTSSTVILIYWLQAIAPEDNNEYVVSPQYGFVEAGGQAHVEITRLDGFPTPSNACMVISYRLTTDESLNEVDSYERYTPMCDIVVVLIAQ